MYHMLVLYLGAVTLLGSIQGSPIPATDSVNLLQAIQSDIKSLNNLQKVTEGYEFFTPTRINATSLSEALACFALEMCSIEEVLENENEVNTEAINISHLILENASGYLNITESSCENVSSSLLVSIG
ncbi:Hypothetical predicted protein [Pelobates cultripes]|uniref:Interleukin-2 n=1 Tax=Pelobates cultripes TaxID=61616 RepID=A0AAD1SH06_PELCU|nr:Hypothetical predicted protein [Pelobates cultripes]